MKVTIVYPYAMERVHVLQEYYMNKGYTVSLCNDFVALESDVLHCILQDFSRVKEIGLYKKRHPNIKLIFDVIQVEDRMNMNFLEQRRWRHIRDSYLYLADFVLCSSEFIKKQISRASVLYPCKEENMYVSSPEFNADELSFCVLMEGTNLDLAGILEVLRSCSTLKRCVLHIMGNSVEKENFIQNVLNVDVNVVDHKILMDGLQRQEVFDQCQYGFNLLDEQGMCQTSLDYIFAGLPIINSVTEDMEQFCSLWDVGLNIYTNTVKDVAHELSHETKKRQLERRKQVRNLYNTYFTKEIFFKTLDEKTGGIL